MATVNAHIPKKLEKRLEDVLIKVDMTKSEFIRACVLEAILKIEIDGEEE